MDRQMVSWLQSSGTWLHVDGTVEPGYNVMKGTEYFVSL
jgi:hypothetical protein